MTEEEYRIKLEECDLLVDHDPDPESQEGKRLEALSAELEEYEKAHFSTMIGRAHAGEEEAEDPPADEPEDTRGV